MISPLPLLDEKPVSIGEKSTRPIDVMVVAAWNDPGAVSVPEELLDASLCEQERQLEPITSRLASFRPTLIVMHEEAPVADASVMRISVRDRLAVPISEKSGARILGIKELLPGEDERLPLSAMKQFADELDIPAWKALDPFKERRSCVAGLLRDLNNDSQCTSLPTPYLILKDRSSRTKLLAEMVSTFFMQELQYFLSLKDILSDHDRVMIISAGWHIYWLKHFIDNDDNFQRVGVRRYL